MIILQVAHNVIVQSLPQEDFRLSFFLHLKLIHFEQRIVSYCMV